MITTAGDRFLCIFTTLQYVHSGVGQESGNDTQQGGHYLGAIRCACSRTLFSYVDLSWLQWGMVEKEGEGRRVGESVCVSIYVPCTERVVCFSMYCNS